MSEGILVVAETRQGALRPVSLELVGAAKKLSGEGAGPVRVLLVGSEVEPQQLAVEGVEEVVVAESPRDHFEAHVSGRALEAAIAELQPAVVLAGHSVDSFGFAPAVAAVGSHGFGTDVTELRWEGGELAANRGVFGGKLESSLRFPDKSTVVLLLRPGRWEPAAGRGGAEARELEVDLAEAARTTRTELREAPVGDVDITSADVLLSIGRGIDDGDNVERFEQLATRLGATLSASRPLVDAGWIPSSRQVGQSGNTVAPKVYLALGISGAVQHLAGIGGAGTVIAVNNDPDAPIFGVADFGVVADLFDVADELERQLP